MINFTVSKKNISTEFHTKHTAGLRKTQALRPSVLAFSLLPLAACQAPQGILVQAPPAGAEPDFIEDPTNVFTARDDDNRFFEDKEATANLTVTGKAGNDHITTGTGDDVIKGGDGNDALVGWDGDDIIDGEGGNDIVSGNDGRDSLMGGSGNDFLSGGTGVDSLDGGTGDDALMLRDRPGDLEDQFDGGEGYDTLYISPVDVSDINILGLDFEDLTGIDLSDIFNEAPVILSLSEISALNFEEIRLNNEGDELTLTAQDVVNVTDGDNSLFIDGNMGATVIGDMAQWTDTSVQLLNGDIYYSFSNATAELHINSDIIRLGFQTDEPDFNEVLPNQFVAKDDSDSLMGKQNSTDNLTITGGAGNDKIWTGSGADTIDAGAGNDHVKSGFGNDSITGGDGTDILSGQDGNDVIYGGLGNDQIFGGNDQDILYGGDDNDLILGGLGADTLEGGNGDDALFGNFGDDILYGGAGNDVLMGDDILIGAILDDTNILDGGDGDDELWGDNGDLLDGGEGHDVWVISSNSIDFSLITVVDIEEIRLGANPLTLSQQDVLDMTDEDNELIITGIEEAIVTSTGQSWVLGADQVIDDEVYHTYTSGDATLLVDAGIGQDIT